MDHRPLSMEDNLKNDITLYPGNCFDVLKALEANSIDSCVTDPPYGLSFMGKSWDYDVPKKEIWQEVLRVLKPGGHLLAFFGSRTYHRGVVQIEDAGFEVRDQIMWLYGSGFPKSHDVSKAIDKEAGAERKIIEQVKKVQSYGYKNNNVYGSDFDRGGVQNITEPATDEAKQWEGWGTALKPAHEPIVVARKPITQTLAKNVLEYGTGALNIDGCRVEHVTVDGGSLATNPHLRSKIKGGNGGNIFPTETESRIVNVSPLGRWPANVIHDGSDEVISQFPNETSRFFYCAKASKADRGEGNKHPTVKPTELMKYLCRLVTPKGGVVLDPFMGSGSTGKAALLEDFSFIGIESDEKYFTIAQDRLKRRE